MTMAVNNPYAKYQQSSIETKSPGELTLMLYEGCLKFIRLGKEAMAEKKYDVKNTNLQKAQKIIRELMVTLDMDAGVSEEMLTMYDFIHAKLVESNMNNSVEALGEAEKFVTQFRDTWKDVIKEDRKNRFGSRETSAPQASGQASAAQSGEKPAAVPNNPYTQAKQASAAAGSGRTNFRG
ncbi:flagellar protein FliS [Salisediminibacterium halotolerans]|uniref:Flagellar protein FliS n=1 Tax=Salisediminibacterium halotolerans TaxID=517425 RepID=A0A1H9VKW6_9BACI|nr:flagellar protein FliS [Salisediminibacterium haloalkalitolerans]